jgi:thioredoxin-dependent peroxiredoxin
MRHHGLAWLGLLMLAASCTSAGRSDQPLLPVGAAAPDVAGKDGKGATVTLAAQKGRYAIVYFYPKDDTPGCTREANEFRDATDQLSQSNVMVFGVSRDSEDSHRAFQDKYALPFTLVADPSGAIQRAYRVPGVIVAKRVSFLVGPDGKIARVWPVVDPAVHASEVLDAVAALKRKT